MKKILSTLLLVQRELRQFYASDKDSQALSELSKLIKEAEQETPIETPWDFVEKYYPNYYGSDTIAYADDLSKLLNNEQEEDSDAHDILMNEYDGDINNPEIQKEYDRVHREIYEDAIEGYINSLKK